MAKQSTPDQLPARRLEMHNPADVIAAGKLLQSFIKQQKLSTQVQGKEFVNVEGWQYAGSLFGWNTKAEHCINISNEHEIKYQAKVIVLDPDGREIGAGFGICSNKESGKKFYQEFAIASMAQTRGVGKAYRNSLAFLMRLAGFEATPAEEMEYTGNVPTPATAPVPVMQAITTPPQAPTLIGNGTDSVPQNVSGGGTETETPPFQYATASQKETIIRLLNHPLITRPEKTKMLLNINRLDEERATQAIKKLEKAIEDREGTSAVAS